MLSDKELVKLSDALVNLQEDLPSEIQSILDSNVVVFSGVADYNFKKSLLLVNMAKQFFNFLLLKQLNQVELANASRDVLLLNRYIALKRTALDCYDYANFETKEGFIEHMAYITCVPAQGNFTLPSIFGLEALKHLNALNGQANNSYDIKECLGYPMVAEGLNECLLSKSLAVINYGTMAVACELAIYLCNAKTQKELKSYLDTINIAINAIKYIKQTKNISYLTSQLFTILSAPSHVRDLAQEVLELAQVLAATITLLAPVSARCQSLSDADVLQPLQKMLKHLLKNPLTVLSDMNLNQDLNKVDIYGELSLFNKESLYYPALSAEHFIESVRLYEYGPIGSLHCHIFGIELAKLLSPTPDRVSPLLRNGRLTNCAKQPILNFLDKNTSVLNKDELLKGLCGNLTTVQATASSKAYAFDSLISQVLSSLAVSKTSNLKLKKAATSSEDLAQAETAVVAAKAESKADAKPKAKAKSSRSKAKQETTQVNEFNFVDATGTGDIPIYQNKRDALQAMKKFFKAQRAALDNAQDKTERSMIYRRLQIMEDFLNKGIMLARGLHVSKAKFELFAKKIEVLYLNSLYQGMKYEDVRALTDIMNLFLQYIELMQHDRNFNNGLYYLAKAKAEYIPSAIQP